MPHLILSTHVGARQLVNYVFDVDKPHAGCCICGEVYQSDYDRSGEDPATAFIMRNDWRLAHARTHPDWQHRQLANSGLFALPEAAVKLASYGIIPLTDTVRHDESTHALLEAPRAPYDDATGS
jgi:hypothetical protein